MFGELSPKSNGGAKGLVIGGGVTALPSFSPNAITIGSNNINTSDGIVIGNGVVWGVGTTGSTRQEGIIIGNDVIARNQGSFTNLYNLIIGSHLSVTGANNIVIKNALSATTRQSITGSSNTIVGSDFPNGVLTSNNTFVGHQSFTDVQGGSNVVVGRWNASAAVGTSNTYLGGDLVNSSSAFNYSIAIGNGHTTKSGSTTIGRGAKAVTGGEFAYSANYSTSIGDTQVSIIPLWTQTTNATVTELGATAINAGGSSETTPTGRVILENDSTYIFDCDIVARNTTTDTESAVWNIKFGIRRGAAAANTALIGTPTKTTYGQDTGTTSWDVSVTADTTNGRPNISVTGEAGKTIRWLANCRVTKVTG